MLNQLQSWLKMDRRRSATTLQGTPGRAARARRRSGGFTLIEAALTTVIIGTGVLAIVAAQQAYHQKNMWAQRSSTGILLCNELRELTMTLPMHDPFTGNATVGAETNETTPADFDDLDDFAGTVDGATGVGAGLTFSPPINALRMDIDNLPGWSQIITVENVLPENISSTFAQPLGTTELMRVTVRAQYQGPNDPSPTTVAQLNWVVGK